MNTLLICFAFPIAVIIISAVLQMVLKNPVSIAALTFAIFLIVTFAAFDETFLIATLIYTLLSFITALLFNKILKSLCNNRDICQNNEENNDNEDNSCDLLDNIVNNSNIGCGRGCNRFMRYR